MFGVMYKNGKCVENHATLDVYRIRFNNLPSVAVPKDYINLWKSGHKCEQEGCFKDGCVECILPKWKSEPDEPQITVEHFCPEHAFRNGYCICCGEFFGGIEGFDSGNGLCDNCDYAI